MTTQTSRAPLATLAGVIVMAYSAFVTAILAQVL